MMSDGLAKSMLAAVLFSCIHYIHIDSTSRQLCWKRNCCYPPPRGGRGILLSPGSSVHPSGWLGVNIYFNGGGFPISDGYIFIVSGKLVNGVNVDINMHNFMKELFHHFPSTFLKRVLKLTHWTNGYFFNGESANVNKNHSQQNKTGKSGDGTSRMGEVIPVDTDLLGPGTTEGTVFNLWWHKQRTVPLYLVLIVLPLLNFKSAQFFARFNNLGTLSVAYLVILVTIKAAHWGIHLEYHWTDCDNPLFVPEFRSFFPAMTGILTLAFFIHNCSITLFKNNRNQHNNVRDLVIAYVLVGSTYLYVGCLVFASFPVNPLSKSCIEQNFLDNFPADDITTFIARVCLLFQLMTVYPLLAFFIRVQLFTQLFGKSYPSFLHVLFLNVILVTTGVIMATFYPNIGTIIRYSGAICGLAFVFIFPCLIHLIFQRRCGRLTASSVIFHSLFMLLGLANLFAQFLI
uniref:Neutral amino acid transporter 9 n=1 Tax=Eptatretus burgeri TaxID=7764 RepID=A0A8C4Q0A7_EPTBU